MISASRSIELVWTYLRGWNVQRAPSSLISALIMLGYALCFVAGERKANHADFI